MSKKSRYPKEKLREWASLYLKSLEVETLEEKIEITKLIIQDIANHRLKKPICVSFKHFERNERGFTSAGEYNPIHDAIEINEEHFAKMVELDEFGELLILIAHECRHAEQFRKEAEVEEIGDKEKNGNFDEDKFWAESVNYVGQRGSFFGDSREEVEQYLALFYPELVTQKNNDIFSSNEINRTLAIEDILTGIYLDESIEKDARIHSMFEAHRLISDLYSNLQNISKEKEIDLDLDMWKAMQIASIRIRVKDENHMVSQIYRATDFFKIDVSSERLAEISQRIQDVASAIEIIKKRNSSDSEIDYDVKSEYFQMVATRCLEKMFDGVSLEKLLEYHKTLSGIGLSSDKNNEQREPVFVLRILESKILESVRQVEDVESLGLDEQWCKDFMFAALRGGADVSYSDVSKYLTREEKIELLKNSYEGVKYPEVDIELLQSLNPESEEDRAVVEAVLEQFKSKYRLSYDKLEGSPNEVYNGLVRSERFEVVYGSEVASGIIQEVMERFGFGKEFAEILERPELVGGIDSEIYALMNGVEPIRKENISELSIPEGMTEDEFLEKVRSGKKLGIEDDELLM